MKRILSAVPFSLNLQEIVKTTASTNKTSNRHPRAYPGSYAHLQSSSLRKLVQQDVSQKGFCISYWSFKITRSLKGFVTVLLNAQLQTEVRSACCTTWKTLNICPPRQTKWWCGGSPVGRDSHAYLYHKYFFFTINPHPIFFHCVLLWHWSYA